MVTAQTTVSGDVIAGAVIGSVLLAILYFAPTMTAAMRRSPNLLAVALINFFLGWTIIGWIVAWVLCFSGGTPQVTYTGYHYYGGPQLLPGLSPDGRYWWDGAAWRDTMVAAPPHAPRSPDGAWWWDGVRWRPFPPPPPA